MAHKWATNMPPEKSVAKEVLLKTTEDFNGINTDSEDIKIAGISKIFYYKYNAELKTAAGK